MCYDQDVAPMRVIQFCASWPHILLIAPSLHASMKKIVLLRHGESDWNRENRFTGWTDVDLSERGIEEARAAGRWLKCGGYSFDLAYTSVLRRAIRTLWLGLDELDRMWIPVEKHWRLNE